MPAMSVTLKVKISLSLTKHCVMKAYWVMEIQIHVFLTSALVGGEWSASRPWRINPGETVRVTHWTGDWMDLRAGLALPELELQPLGRPASSQSSHLSESSKSWES
jgi:hypothetical protein